MILLRVVTSVMWVTAAIAAPATFTFTGSAFGSLGSATFTNAFYTITAIGDTNLVFAPDASSYRMPITDATIQIVGLPLASFADPTYILLNVPGWSLFFYDANQGLIENTAAFQPYDLKESYLLSSGTFASNPPQSPIPTSQGTLNWRQVLNSTNTFEEVVIQGPSVPEPNTVFMLVVGFAMVVLLRSLFDRTKTI